MSSKYVHEVGQYLLDFDDFSAVEKPSTSASQRYQNHQNPIHIDPFHQVNTYSILTIFAPLKSPQHQLSNGTKLSKSDTD